MKFLKNNWRELLLAICIFIGVFFVLPRFNGAVDGTTGTGLDSSYVQLFAWAAFKAVGCVLVAFFILHVAFPTIRLYADNDGFKDDFAKLEPWQRARLFVAVLALALTLVAVCLLQS